MSSPGHEQGQCSTGSGTPIELVLYRLAPVYTQIINCNLLSVATNAGSGIDCRTSLHPRVALYKCPRLSWNDLNRYYVISIFL